MDMAEVGLERLHKIQVDTLSETDIVHTDEIMVGLAGLEPAGPPHLQWALPAELQSCSDLATMVMASSLPRTGRLHLLSIFS